MNEKKKHIFVLVISLFLLIILFILSVALGSVKISFTEIFYALLGDGDYENERTILLSLRLPRAVGALLAGAALASSGLLLQSATGNDLCAPNIIGVNSGAGFFVILTLSLLPSSLFALPFSAFFGALFATALVLLISSFSKERRSSLVLSGVAVGAFFNAGISFLSFAYPDVLLSYTSFTAGSLSGVYAEDIIIPAIIISLCLILSFLLFPRLRILCLGESIANSLGVNVRLIRVIALILASGMCAASVSYAGLIGFAGLIVPHVARRLTSSDSNLLLPVTLIQGGCILLLSDLLSRIIFSPSELPCGIIMSFIGAPFFVFLICRRKKNA